MLAYGIHDLQEAGILPGLNNLAFDVSHLIPPTSVPGTLLKGIFNFSPATTWLEATAWVLYVVPTMILFLRRIRRRSRPAKPAARGRPCVRNPPMTPPSRAAPAPVRSRPPRPSRSGCRCWPPAPTTRRPPAAPRPIRAP